jgi:predicted RNA-binding protein associated with RNAse of E/G family
MTGQPRIFYRKEKLRGACWEYQVDGGWVTAPGANGDRHLLRHRFSLYRPREAEVRTPEGIVRLHKAKAEQWFFPDRWFSLLRFMTSDDRIVGYYVNFSQPLSELRANYYRDLDLELDLWVDPDGTATILDQDEFDEEIASERLPGEWAREVTNACEAVSAALSASIARHGPDVEADRDPDLGLPGFILRA